MYAVFSLNLEKFTPDRQFFTLAPPVVPVTNMRYVHMTALQYRGKYQLQCVTANLTLHMMLKIEFQPDFLNPQMLSFPNMYNTMVSKMDGLAVREHFLSKIAEKTAFWAATFSDHLTSQRSSTQNFKD